MGGSRPREGRETGLDVVVDPVRVPPLDRVDVDAVDHDAEVEMVAGREAGVARLADDVAALDRGPDGRRDLAQMAVEREEPEAVVEDDRVPVDAERRGEYDAAVVAGRHGAAAVGGQVEPEMRLVVDRLAAVEVGAVVGEAGERLRPGLPEKGALPQGLRRAVAAEIPQPLLGRDAQLAVDAEVAGHESAVAGEAVRLDERGDLAPQKIVAQL